VKITRTISYVAIQMERVATSKCDRNDIPRMMWVEILACAMFSLLLSHTIFDMLDVLMTHPTMRQTENPTLYLSFILLPPVPPSAVFYPTLVLVHGARPLP
jgi:hypothetical protein